MKWLKRIVVVLLLVGVALAAALALRPRPTLVDTAVVGSGRFTQSIDEDGKTRVRQRYVVSAPLSGMLDRIRLQPGDAVEEGAVIATLVPAEPPLLDARSRRELDARVAVAQAARLRADTTVEAAKVANDYAERELDKTRKLVASGTLSQSEFDRIELEQKAKAKELEAARFGARVARHEVDAAAALATRRTGKSPGGEPAWQIRSPGAGRILRVLSPNAGVVAAGTPLVELADPSALEVVVDILTTDAVQIPVGAPVDIDHWGGTTVLQGRVRLIEPSATTRVSALGVEEQRVDVVVDILSPQAEWKTLGDGFRVEARIVVFRADVAVKVPVSALFRDADRWSVYLVDGDRVRRRAVEIGHRSASDATVEKGLAPGDTVVVYPGDAVVDGARIETRPHDGA